MITQCYTEGLEESTTKKYLLFIIDIFDDSKDVTND